MGTWTLERKSTRYPFRNNFLSGAAKWGLEFNVYNQMNLFYTYQYSRFLYCIFFVHGLLSLLLLQLLFWTWHSVEIAVFPTCWRLNEWLGPSMNVSLVCDSVILYKATIFSFWGREWRTGQVFGYIDRSSPKCGQSGWVIPFTGIWGTSLMLLP